MNVVFLIPHLLQKSKTATNLFLNSFDIPHDKRHSCFKLIVVVGFNAVLVYEIIFNLYESVVFEQVIFFFLP